MGAYYDVRVYWPNEGYGGGRGELTKEQADKEVENLKRQGYGKARNPIRVLFVRHIEIVREVNDQPE